ncbi:MAG TPA: GNAT family N-acetyltransferase [Rhizobacter sp.]|nr:GNAT family N-acetyltransferase [Rhizobacter sp.]
MGAQLPHTATRLVPMHPQRFEAFAEEAITTHADHNAQVGRWPRETALERARAEFARLLPQGQQTPEHFFYEIEDQALGEKVGYLWFAVIGPADARGGYVYNIRVRPEFRGRGHAKAALDLIEAVALDMGLDAIGLHVFSFNTNAQALYRSSGYGITGMNMLKPLRRDGR